MTDNVAFTPGSGAILAADEIGGVLYPRSKIILGADGVNDGDVSATNPLPIYGNVAIPGGVSVGGTVNIANFPSTQTIAGGVTVSSGSIALAAGGAQIGTVTGSTVTLTGALPAGTNSLGTVSIASGATVAITGGLTDAQLRASAVPVTANAGTNLNTSALALETGGNLATLVARTPALGQAAMAASQPVVLASDQSVVPVNQSGQSATGSLAALNAVVALSLNGATGFAVDLRGTFVATVLVQGTIDGTNWITLSVLPVGAGLNIAQVASATAPGAWWGNGNGFQQIRATASAYTSGSVTVTLRAMQATGMVFNLPAGQTTQPVSGTVTANIGTGALAAGTNAIGDVGVQYRASATGAASRSHLVAAASTNATVAKASAGRLLGWSLLNTTASPKYVKLHNQATAPTAGTGVVQTIAIPANGMAQMNIEGGIAFATGIAFTTVTGSLDTDATAVAAGDIVGDLFFA